MTLDEAIIKLENKILENESLSDTCNAEQYPALDYRGEYCLKVANEYKQIVSWLKELKQYHEGTVSANLKLNAALDKACYKLKDYDNCLPSTLRSNRSIEEWKEFLYRNN